MSLVISEITTCNIYNIFWETEMLFHFNITADTIAKSTGYSVNWIQYSANYTSINLTGTYCCNFVQGQPHCWMPNEEVSSRSAYQILQIAIAAFCQFVAYSL